VFCVHQWLRRVGATDFKLWSFQLNNSRRCRAHRMPGVSCSRVMLKIA
jgi:hypothetical protein